MSRALNIEATKEHVLATCAKHRLDVSSMEPLLPTGVRIVLKNGDDAAIIRKAYAKSIIEGVVRRVPLRLEKA